MQTVVSVTPLAVGRDSRTFKIAASLARAGHRSIVVEAEASAPSPEPLPFELRSLGAPSPIPPREGARPRATSLVALARRLPWAFEAARAIRHLRRLNLPLLPALPPADVYYLHAPYQFPAVAWHARRHGAALVYDAHDFYTVLYDPPSPFVRWLEASCVRRADAVVTVSDGVAALIEGEFGRRPVVLTNAHDPRLDRPRPRSIREELGVPPDAFCLVTSGGNAEATWTLEPLLEALALLPTRVRLLMLGSGCRAFLPEIRRAGLEGRVHIADSVGPAEVVPFLRGADAFVIAYGAPHANFEHSLPNRFFQAVAAGLPVLHPPLPELARLAARFGIGVAIDPSSARSIAEGVARLLDPGARADLAERLRRAGAELSWEREEPDLLALVREAADARRGGAARA